MKKRQVRIDQNLKRIVGKIFTAAGIVLLAAVFYFAIAKVYPFNWGVVLKYRTMFLKGLTVTFQVSAVSIFISFGLGLVFSIMKTSKVGFFKDIAAIYVWIFRNTPLLVVILLTYYGVGTILHLNRFWAAVLALSLFEGAYMTEIIRSGIEAVDPGEIEAAHSLGMTNLQIFLSIVFPQAIRISLPPLIGQMISLVKDSSLASVIALGELTMMGRQVGTSSFATFESYIIVAFIYIMLTSVLSILGRYLERRMSLA
ncbi:MAG: amino acid ABC transporter permease [Thermotogaceae bacterium]|nr:amino acid ABC transporter permease [Thermotogaceae bacterium]